MSIDTYKFHQYLANFNSKNITQFERDRDHFANRIEAGEQFETATRLLSAITDESSLPGKNNTELAKLIRDMSPVRFSAFAHDLEERADLSVRYLSMTNDAFTANWEQLTNQSHRLQTLQEMIDGYRNIQLWRNKAGKEKPLILALDVVQGDDTNAGPHTLNKHIGHPGEFYKQILVDMDILVRKYPGAHKELLLLMNGDFSDSANQSYDAIRQIGTQLTLGANQTDVRRIPIDQTIADRIKTFLANHESDELVVYVLAGNRPDDAYQRIGGAFRAAAIARLLRDFGVLSKFSKVQINLQACDVGYNAYRNATGQNISGKIGEDFCNALKALSGTLSDESANSIVDLLTARDDRTIPLTIEEKKVKEELTTLAEQKTKATDDNVRTTIAEQETRARTKLGALVQQRAAALSEERWRIEEEDRTLAALKSLSPHDFQLQVRFPNYTFWIELSGHKVYKLARNKKPLFLRSEMNEAQRSEYKTTYYLLPDGEWLKAGPRLDLEKLIDVAAMEIRLLKKQWLAWDEESSIADQDSFSKRALKKTKLNDFTAEVVGKIGSDCYFVKLEGDLPLRESNKLAVAKTGAANIEVEGGGGIGQRFTVTFENQQPVFALIGDIIPPQSKPQSVVASTETPLEKNLEQVLARQLKVEATRIDLRVLDDEGEELLQTARDVQQHYREIKGRIGVIRHEDENAPPQFTMETRSQKIYPRFLVTHLDEEHVYLQQDFPPTWPEKRVIEVKRDQFPAAFSNPDEPLRADQAFIFESDVGEAELPVLQFKRDRPYQEEGAINTWVGQGRETLRKTAEASLLEQSTGEWNRMRYIVPAAIAELTRLQTYLNKPIDLAIHPQLVNLQESIATSLEKMIKHVERLGQPFDKNNYVHQCDLWDIKKTLRQEKRYNDGAREAAWKEMYRDPEWKLRQTIDAYQRIQEINAVKGKENILLMGLTVIRGDQIPDGPYARNEHIGVDGKYYIQIQFDLDLLAGKYPGRTHKEVLVYLNGDFRDPRHEESRLIGTQLTLASDATHVAEVPIPPQSEKRIQQFLRTVENAPEHNDTLTLYIYVANFQNDPYERVAGAFQAAPIAKVVRDLGLLTGERFKQVQINLLACNVGHNQYRNIPGKVAEDFAKAIKAFSGTLPNQRATQIADALLAEDDAALTDLVTMPPRDFNLQIRVPNYVLWVQEDGGKAWAMVRDKKQLVRRSEMSARERNEYKTIYHLLPIGEWLKISASTNMRQLILDAKIKLQVMKRWGISPDHVFMMIDKSVLEMWKKDFIAEVIGEDGEDRYVVRMHKVGQHELGPTLTVAGQIKVGRLRANHFENGGGIGQQFSATHSGKKQPVKIEIIGDPIEPQQEPQVVIAPEKNLEQHLVERLKTDSFLVDLVTEENVLEDLIETFSEAKQKYHNNLDKPDHVETDPPDDDIKVRPQFKVTYFDEKHVYLQQHFPPTYPEKRVFEVPRSRFSAAFLNQEKPLHEDQWFIFEMSHDESKQDVPQFVNRRSYHELGKEHFWIGRARQRIQVAAERAIVTQSKREWDAQKNTVSAAVAVLTQWRDYLDGRENLSADRELTALREMIGKSLDVMASHQTQFELPFDASNASHQYALWRIKKDMREQRKRYDNNSLLAAAANAGMLLPIHQGQNAHTIGADFDHRITEYINGRADDDLQAMETAAKAEGLVDSNGRGNIRRYILALAKVGIPVDLSQDIGDSKSTIFSNAPAALFWSNLPAPYHVEQWLEPVQKTYHFKDSERSLSLVFNSTASGEIHSAHVPIPDNPELIGLFGSPGKPTRVGSAIVHEGAIAMDPIMQIFPYGKKVRLSAEQQQMLKENSDAKLAYVIDKRGSIRIGNNHISLMAGGDAYFGGELAYDSAENSFYITNKSPYSQRTSRIDNQHINAVLAFFNQPGFSTQARWFAHEGNWFSESNPKIAKPFISIFPSAPKIEIPVSTAVAAYSLEEVISKTDMQTAFEAINNNKLFSHGGYQYEACLEATISFFDAEEFSRYVRVLGRGIADLSSGNSSASTLSESEKRRLLEQSYDRSSKAVQHYIESIHAKALSSDMPVAQKIGSWLALSSGFDYIEGTESFYSKMATGLITIPVAELAKANQENLFALTTSLGKHAADASCRRGLNRIAEYLLSPHVQIDQLDADIAALLIASFDKLSQDNKQSAGKKGSDACGKALEQLRERSIDYRIDKTIGRMQQQGADKFRLIANFVEREGVEFGISLIGKARRENLIVQDEMQALYDTLSGTPVWFKHIESLYPNDFDEKTADLRRRVKELDQKVQIKKDNAKTHWTAIERYVQMKQSGNANADKTWNDYVEKTFTSHRLYVKAIGEAYAELYFNGGVQAKKVKDPLMHMEWVRLKVLPMKQDELARTERGTASTLTQRLLEARLGRVENIDEPKEAAGHVTKADIASEATVERHTDLEEPDPSRREDAQGEDVLKVERKEKQKAGYGTNSDFLRLKAAVDKHRQCLLDKNASVPDQLSAAKAIAEIMQLKDDVEWARLYGEEVDALLIAKKVADIRQNLLKHSIVPERVAALFSMVRVAYRLGSDSGKFAEEVLNAFAEKFTSIEEKRWMFAVYTFYDASRGLYGDVLPSDAERAVKRILEDEIKHKQCERYAIGVWQINVPIIDDMVMPAVVRGVTDLWKSKNQDGLDSRWLIDLAFIQNAFGGKDKLSRLLGGSKHFRAYLMGDVVDPEIKDRTAADIEDADRIGERLSSEPEHKRIYLEEIKSAIGENNSDEVDLITAARRRLGAGKSMPEQDSNFLNLVQTWLKVRNVNDVTSYRLLTFEELQVYISEDMRNLQPAILAKQMIKAFDETVQRTVVAIPTNTLATRDSLVIGSPSDSSIEEFLMLLENYKGSNIHKSTEAERRIFEVKDDKSNEEWEDLLKSHDKKLFDISREQFEYERRCLDYPIEKNRAEVLIEIARGHLRHIGENDLDAIETRASWLNRLNGLTIDEKDWATVICNYYDRYPHGEDNIPQDPEMAVRIVKENGEGHEDLIKDTFAAYKLGDLDWQRIFVSFADGLEQLLVERRKLNEPKDSDFLSYLVLRLVKRVPPCEDNQTLINELMKCHAWRMYLLETYEDLRNDRDSATVMRLTDRALKEMHFQVIACRERLSEMDVMLVDPSSLKIQSEKMPDVIGIVSGAIEHARQLFEKDLMSRESYTLLVASMRSHLMRVGIDSEVDLAHISRIFRCYSLDAELEFPKILAAAHTQALATVSADLQLIDSFAAIAGYPFEAGHAHTTHNLAASAAVRTIVEESTTLDEMNRRMVQLTKSLEGLGNKAPDISFIRGEEIMESLLAKLEEPREANLDNDIEENSEVIRTFCRTLRLGRDVEAAVEEIGAYYFNRTNETVPENLEEAWISVRNDLMREKQLLAEKITRFNESAARGDVEAEDGLAKKNKKKKKKKTKGNVSAVENSEQVISAEVAELADLYIQLGNVGGVEETDRFEALINDRLMHRSNAEWAKHMAQNPKWIDIAVGEEELSAQIGEMLEAVRYPIDNEIDHDRFKKLLEQIRATISELDLNDSNLPHFDWQDVIANISPEEKNWADEVLGFCARYRGDGGILSDDPIDVSQQILNSPIKYERYLKEEMIKGCLDSVRPEDHSLEADLLLFKEKFTAWQSEDSEDNRIALMIGMAKAKIRLGDNDRLSATAGQLTKDSLDRFDDEVEAAATKLQLALSELTPKHQNLLPEIDNKLVGVIREYREKQMALRDSSDTLRYILSKEEFKKAVMQLGISPLEQNRAQYISNYFSRHPEIDIPNNYKKARSIALTGIEREVKELNGAAKQLRRPIKVTSKTEVKRISEREFSDFPNKLIAWFKAETVNEDDERSLLLQLPNITALVQIVDGPISDDDVVSRLAQSPEWESYIRPDIEDDKLYILSKGHKFNAKNSDTYMQELRTLSELNNRQYSPPLSFILSNRPGVNISDADMRGMQFMESFLIDHPKETLPESIQDIDSARQYLEGRWLIDARKRLTSRKLGFLNIAIDDAASALTSQITELRHELGDEVRRSGEKLLDSLKNETAKLSDIRTSENDNDARAISILDRLEKVCEDTGISSSDQDRLMSIAQYFLRQLQLTIPNDIDEARLTVLAGIEKEKEILDKAIGKNLFVTIASIMLSRGTHDMSSTSDEFMYKRILTEAIPDLPNIPVDKLADWMVEDINGKKLIERYVHNKSNGEGQSNDDNEETRSTPFLTRQAVEYLTDILNRARRHYEGELNQLPDIREDGGIQLKAEDKNKVSALIGKSIQKYPVPLNRQALDAVLNDFESGVRGLLLSDSQTEYAIQLGRYFIEARKFKNSYSLKDIQRQIQRDKNYLSELKARIDTALGIPIKAVSSSSPLHSQISDGRSESLDAFVNAFISWIDAKDKPSLIALPAMTKSFEARQNSTPNSALAKEMVGNQVWREYISSQTLPTMDLLREMERPLSIGEDEALLDKFRNFVDADDRDEAPLPSSALKGAQEESTSDEVTRCINAMEVFLLTYEDQTIPSHIKDMESLRQHLYSSWITLELTNATMEQLDDFDAIFSRARSSLEMTLTVLRDEFVTKDVGVHEKYHDAIAASIEAFDRAVRSREQETDSSQDQLCNSILQAFIAEDYYLGDLLLRTATEGMSNQEKIALSDALASKPGWERALYQVPVLRSARDFYKIGVESLEAGFSAESSETDREYWHGCLNKFFKDLQSGDPAIIAKASKEWKDAYNETTFPKHTDDLWCIDYLKSYYEDPTESFPPTLNETIEKALTGCRKQLALSIEQNTTEYINRLLLNDVMLKTEEQLKRSVGALENESRQPLIEIRNAAKDLPNVKEQMQKANLAESYYQNAGRLLNNYHKRIQLLDHQILLMRSMISGMVNADMSIEDSNIAKLSPRYIELRDQRERLIDNISSMMKKMEAPIKILQNYLASHSSEQYTDTVNGWNNDIRKKYENLHKKLKEQLALLDDQLPIGLLSLADDTPAPKLQMLKSDSDHKEDAESKISSADGDEMDGQEAHAQMTFEVLDASDDDKLRLYGIGDYFIRHRDRGIPASLDEARQVALIGVEMELRALHASMELNKAETTSELPVPHNPFDNFLDAFIKWINQREQLSLADLEDITSLIAIKGRIGENGAIADLLIGSESWKRYLLHKKEINDSATAERYLSTFDIAAQYAAQNLSEALRVLPGKFLIDGGEASWFRGLLTDSVSAVVAHNDDLASADAENREALANVFEGYVSKNDEIRLKCIRNFFVRRHPALQIPESLDEARRIALDGVKDEAVGLLASKLVEFISANTRAKRPTLEILTDIAVLKTALAQVGLETNDELSAELCRCPQWEEFARTSLPVETEKGKPNDVSLREATRLRLTKVGDTFTPFAQELYKGLSVLDRTFTCNEDAVLFLVKDAVEDMQACLASGEKGSDGDARTEKIREKLINAGAPREECNGLMAVINYFFNFPSKKIPATLADSIKMAKEGYQASAAILAVPTMHAPSRPTDAIVGKTEDQLTSEEQTKTDQPGELKEEINAEELDESVRVKLLEIKSKILKSIEEDNFDDAQALLMSVAVLQENEVPTEKYVQILVNEFTNNTKTWEIFSRLADHLSPDIFGSKAVNAIQVIRSELTQYVASQKQLEESMLFSSENEHDYLRELAAKAFRTGDLESIPSDKEDIKSLVVLYLIFCPGNADFPQRLEAARENVIDAILKKRVGIAASILLKGVEKGLSIELSGIKEKATGNQNLATILAAASRNDKSQVEALLVKAVVNNEGPSELIWNLAKDESWQRFIAALPELKEERDSADNHFPSSTALLHLQVDKELGDQYIKIIKEFNLAETPPEEVTHELEKTHPTIPAAHRDALKYILYVRHSTSMQFKETFDEVKQDVLKWSRFEKALNISIGYHMMHISPMAFIMALEGNNKNNADVIIKAVLRYMNTDEQKEKWSNFLVNHPNRKVIDAKIKLQDLGGTQQAAYDMLQMTLQRLETPFDMKEAKTVGQCLRLLNNYLKNPTEGLDGFKQKIPAGGVFLEDVLRLQHIASLLTSEPAVRGPIKSLDEGKQIATERLTGRMQTLRKKMADEFLQRMRDEGHRDSLETLAEKAVDLIIRIKEIKDENKDEKKEEAISLGKLITENDVANDKQFLSIVRARLLQRPEWNESLSTDPKVIAKNVEHEKLVKQVDLRELNPKTPRLYAAAIEEYFRTAKTNQKQARVNWINQFMNRNDLNRNVPMPDLNCVTAIRNRYESSGISPNTDIDEAKKDILTILRQEHVNSSMAIKDQLTKAYLKQLVVDAVQDFQKQSTFSAKGTTTDQRLPASRRSSTASTLTIAPDMEVSGELSTADRDFINRRFGHPLDPTQMEEGKNTKINGTPIRITAQDTVLYEKYEVESRSRSHHHTLLKFKPVRPAVASVGWTGFTVF